MNRVRKNQLAAIAAVFMAGILAGGLSMAQSKRTAPASTPAPAPSSESVSSQIPLTGFSSIVKKAVPAVVSIFVDKTVQDRGGFSSRIPGFQGFQMPQERTARASGSGVIVTPDGYILTNNHVVDSATRVHVVLSDKREFDAKVIGADEKSDVALVKVDAAGLPTLPLGDSSRVEVGDIALAIGNPFGLNQTVTMGIVSALDRSNLNIEGNGGYENFIQTDAAVNPGNSGGALVNTQGQMIGINTAIYSSGGGSEGVGFAIPSNMAHQIMVQIRDHGQVTRGWLGISIQEMNASLSKAFGVRDNIGALVSGVEPDGPAAQAGLQKGDVIRAIDGVPVSDLAAMRLKIASTVPGSAIALKVQRDGVERSLSVKVGTMPGAEKVASAIITPELTPSGGKIGVSIEDITPQIASQLGVNENTAGVVIVDVASESPAAASGIQSGDIVQEVNRTLVKNVDDFRAALSKTSDSLLLLINRGGQTLYAVVDRKA